MEEWKYSSTFLGLGNRWTSAVSFQRRLLDFRGKSPQYPLDRRLGVVLNWSGRCEEKPFTRFWDRTPNVQPVAIPINLP
jgi:hypothetical protein